MRVFKYKIPVSDEPMVRLPLGAQILSVGQQNNEIFLWALVDPSEQRTEGHTFRVAGTGHEIADIAELNFLGTVHLHDGALVFHVFRAREDLQGMVQKWCSEVLAKDLGSR